MGTVGSYVDDVFPSGFSYVLDDVQFSTTFDAAWYPGSGGSNPSRLRFRIADLWFMVPVFALVWRRLCVT
jgi:hypothetical protein